MNIFNNIESLKEADFTGFKTVEELWNNRSDIPKEKGVYVVINPDFQKPEFINPGVGGFFKNRNPNVSIEELQRNLVQDSPVVYIGKAGSSAGNATLHSRIGQYLQFGRGKKVGHWGGRLIWQFKNHRDLIFCWKLTPENDPRKIEMSLIDEYRRQYGKLPFANLAG